MDSAIAHGAILSMQTQVARKEWRAVTEGSGRDRLSGDGPSEHGRMNGSARMRSNSGLHHENSRNGRIFHSASSASSSDSDHHAGDLGAPHIGAPAQEVGRQTVAQGDDTKIYDERGAEHLDTTFNDLPIDSGLVNSSKNSGETLDQRLHDVIRQREQLQRMEVELRAQFIARSEVLRVQNSFEEQTEQQASIIVNLQEQLQERERRLHELEQQLQEREQQLHANQREANEVVNQVWAKDGLLREQTNELATLRRDRENVLAEQKTTLAQFEAERAQFLSQLHDLKEQLREKERQLQEIDEQRQSTQDALLYKDEQLREAQAWIQRAHELDAFHANANSSLQAELRDRTDQINQLWLGHQRQLADVERYHMQTIQRLRQEVAEIREENCLLKSACSPDQIESKGEQSAHLSSKEGGLFNVADQSVGSASKLPTSGLTAGNNQVNSNVLPNGTANDSQTIMLQREASAKVEHAPLLPVAASPILGVAPALPSSPAPVFPGQPQGMVSSIPASPLQISQPALSQFSNPVLMQTQPPSLVHPQAMQHNTKQIQQPQSPQVQQYPHQQHMHTYNQLPNEKHPNPVHPRTADPQQQQQQQQQQHDGDQIGLDQGVPLRNNAVHPPQPPEMASDQPNMQLSVHQLQTGHMMHHESSQPPQQQMGVPLQVQHVHEEKHGAYGQRLSLQESQQQRLQLQQDVASQELHEQNKQAERQSTEQGVKPDQVKLLQPLGQQSKLHHLQLLPKSLDSKSLPMQHQLCISNPEEQPLTGSRSSVSHLIANPEVNSKHGPNNQSLQNIMLSANQQPLVSEGNGKGAEPMLLDEKSLLACLVRAIPIEASARIKISTTLPNRLGKMLAPLHWHDYKKQYGRLNEFVSSHPELFVIDGDFIHLWEGAHAIISATTTVAKVAGATAAASPIGASWSPTVAVTPVAQSQVQRLRKVLVAAPMNVKQEPASAQTTNFQQGMLAQLQSNGSGLLNKAVIARSVNGGSNTTGSQPGFLSLNGVTKSGGQRIMTVLGARSDGLLFNSNHSNGVEFGKAPANSYGGATAANQKSGSLYEGRQMTRTTVLGIEPFGKQDFTAPQTQDNRMSRPS